MIVECVGPESSGTRWLTELVGLLKDVDSVHRSVPYGNQWWPDLGPVDYYVVIRRADVATIESQQRHGHMEIWKRKLTPEAKLAKSWEEIRDHLTSMPFIDVTYESLCADTQNELDRIADLLGVPTRKIPKALKSTKA